MNLLGLVLTGLELVVFFYFLPRLIRFGVRLIFYFYAGFWLLLHIMVAFLVTYSCIQGYQDRQPVKPAVAHHSR